MASNEETTDYDEVEGVGECQYPDCEKTAKAVGVVTVGDTPLGPLYVCPDHDEVLG
jgi:hypothetical protein